MSFQFANYDVHQQSKNEKLLKMDFVEINESKGSKRRVIRTSKNIDFFIDRNFSLVPGQKSVICTIVSNTVEHRLRNHLRGRIQAVVLADFALEHHVFSNLTCAFKCNQ